MNKLHGTLVGHSPAYSSDREHDFHANVNSARDEQLDIDFVR